MINVKHALRVWRRHVSVYRKTFHLAFLPNFFEPVFYLISLGMGLGRYMQGGIDGKPYLNYIAPGLVVYQAMIGASYEATYNVFVRMRFARTHDAMLATPLSAYDVALGEVLWSTTRALIYGLGFLLITSVVGALPWAAALAIVPVILLTGFLFSCFGIIYTALIPTIDLFSFYFTLVLTPLFMFSGVFFPVTELPHVVQPLVWGTPLYHSVRIAQDLAWGTLGTSTAVSLAVLAALCPMALWGALRLMQRNLVR